MHRHAERAVRELGIGQRGQRHETLRSRDRRDDEPVQVLQHRACHQFPERTGIAGVRAAERSEVGLSPAVRDHGGWVAESNEEQVQGQTPGPTVAVEERVDPLERAVQSGNAFDEVSATSLDPAGVLDPVAHRCIDLGPGR